MYLSGRRVIRSYRLLLSRHLPRSRYRYCPWRTTTFSCQAFFAHHAHAITPTQIPVLAANRRFSHFSRICLAMLDRQIAAFRPVLERTMAAWRGKQPVRYVLGSLSCISGHIPFLERGRVGYGSGPLTGGCFRMDRPSQAPTCGSFSALRLPSCVVVLHPVRFRQNIFLGADARICPAMGRPAVFGSLAVGEKPSACCEGPAHSCRRHLCRAWLVCAEHSAAPRQFHRNDDEHFARFAKYRRAYSYGGGCIGLGGSLIDFAPISPMAKSCAHLYGALGIAHHARSMGGVCTF